MAINMLRSFGFWMDSIVYWFISVLYEFFIIISKAKIFTDGDISSFYNRIYILVGIFMLFKVSFSLLTMISDPDKLTDKNAGIGKITTRIFISIVMLLFMPTIFKTAYNLQDKIVSSNILGKVIIGTTNENEMDGKKIGKTLSYTTFSAFFYPKVEESGNFRDIPNETVKSTYELAEKKGDISYLSEILNEKAQDENRKNEYIFEYRGLISTATGIFVVFILLSFCMDIGVRTVKLGFLQIIAPIPIISYIDPKSSKDGAFNNWLKTLIMTYLDLFIRLIIIFFVVFLLGRISIMTFDTTNIVLGLFAKVLIIIGALLFAKQAPGLIKDMFGIKGDVASFGDLNPLKKLKSAPGAKAAGFLTGHAAGGLLSMARGKGFGAGWSSGTKGQVKDMSKAHLDKSSAKREVNDRQRDETLGGQYFNAKKHGGNPFKGGNKNAEKFNNSVDKLGEAKGNMYAAQNKRAAIEQNYQAQVQRKAQIQSQIGQQERVANSYAKGTTERQEAEKLLNTLRSQMNAASRDVNSAYKELTDANKMAGTAEGIYNDAKAAHDKLREADTTNAKIQDQMDLYETLHEKTSNVDDFLKP